MYGIFSREFTKYTVIYGVYVRCIYTVLANPMYKVARPPDGCPLWCSKKIHTVHTLCCFADHTYLMPNFVERLVLLRFHKL